MYYTHNVTVHKNWWKLFQRMNPIMYTSNGLRIDSRTQYKLLDMGFTMHDLFGDD